MSTLLNNVSLPLDQYASDDILWLILKLSAQFQMDKEGIMSDQEQRNYRFWADQLRKAYETAKSEEDYTNYTFVCES